MPLSRRQLLKIITGSIAASMLPQPIWAQAKSRPKIKAIAFDGFPIFDPRPIFGLTQKIFPQQGKILAKLWFSKIFGYTWLRTVGANYKGFYAVIEDALLFSTETLKLKLTANEKKELMSSWLKLKVWPDVKSALQLFRKNNIRLGFLSNLSEEMLRQNARNSGIEKAFEFYLSTDRVQAYKPSPSAYKMGVEAFKLPKENIAFAAFGGWDAVGAKWFGYPTVWVNRLGTPLEKLDANLDSTGPNIDQLLKFVLNNKKI